MLLHRLPILVAISFLSTTPCSSYSITPSVFEGDTTSCHLSRFPYPFGISGLNSPRPGFEISCDMTQQSPPMLRLGPTSVIIVEASLEGYVRVLVNAVAWRCAKGPQEESQVPGQHAILSLHDTPYTFSDTKNKLTVIGCDALAVINADDERSHSHGCASFCLSVDSVIDGLCSGVGCCQASIPRGLKSLSLEFGSIRNLTGAGVFDPKRSQSKSRWFKTGPPNYGPCSKAFVLENGTFAFSAADLKERKIDAAYPAVLDWWIGNETCDEAKKNSTSFACTAENSVCYDSSNHVGYRCKCSEGYAGNPYLANGCLDVDECRDPKANPCSHKCVNIEGSFRCRCPFGTRGDGKKYGSDCKRVVGPLEIGLGVGLGFLFILLVVSFWSYWGFQKRRTKSLKQKYFLQNGGLLLQQQIASRVETARIFSAEELEGATDGFDESRVLGHGGYGTVYKGILSEEKVVAIKKSKLIDETQIEQFINEVIILSQISHRNVVKLLGCCLETQVPLLVYEFIPNGTLFHRVHDDASPPMSWETRLTIAVETAAGLAYLHGVASVPVIHRDVKTANILLDENYTAKISDFGASRLVPHNRTHVTTLVQGTLGYLDPEYFHTGLLTEKSDVYSFGVVLVELLTREKALSFCRAEQERNLAAYFVLLVEHDRLGEVIDRQTLEEAGGRHLVAVAQLARRCLSVKGEERPTMREVAVELEALRRLMRQHFVQEGRVRVLSPSNDGTCLQDSMETRLLSASAGCEKTNTH